MFVDDFAPPRRARQHSLLRVNGWSWACSRRRHSLTLHESYRSPGANRRRKGGSMSDQHNTPAVRPFVASDRRSEILPRLVARAAASARVTNQAAIAGPSSPGAIKPAAKGIIKEQHKEIKEKDVNKEHKESKEHKETKENKEHKESKESKENKEAKETKENKDQKDSHKEIGKDDKDGKEDKDFKEDDKEGDKEDKEDKEDGDKIEQAEKEPDKDDIDNGGNGNGDPARRRGRGAASPRLRGRRGSQARPSTLLWGPPIV